jgi:hypothetical protein
MASGRVEAVERKTVSVGVGMAPQARKCLEASTKVEKVPYPSDSELLERAEAQLLVSAVAARPLALQLEFLALRLSLHSVRKRCSSLVAADYGSARR